MSKDGAVELVFGGDARAFRLGIDNLIALQDKLASGPLEIFSRLRSSAWRVQDITETLRIGLIGAGVEPKAALELIEANVRPGNVTPHALTAMAVLLAGLQGDPDDPVGKKRRRRKTPEAPASPPPPSTEPAQQ